MDKQKRIAFFHEDDYCQREILPLTAKNFCLKQMGEINNFSQEHQLESGLFTDIFIRENTPHGIEELGLRSEQLNAVLSFLPPYDLVETGYSSYSEDAIVTLSDRIWEIGDLVEIKRQVSADVFTFHIEVNVIDNYNCD